MRRILGSVAAASLMLSPIATPSMAADAPTAVKVALLDMSSFVPRGASGYGMMGPGMMGQGMGGYGMGGYGMMGPGMMGQGMMGQGMMGGMMSVRVDKSTIKAGPVTFDVTNWSRSAVHEMMIVPVDDSGAPLPYDYSALKVPEGQVKVLGEASDLRPNASKTLEVTLTPGSYLLICNLPGHYAAGMAVPFTVTP